MKQSWPPIKYDEWKDTLDALHMKMQVVGKIKLELNPFLNHWWHVAFYFTSSGMTTGLIPYNDMVFEIDFDFIYHKVIIRTNGEVKEVSLFDCSVAQFYNELMRTLNNLDIKITINTLPSEVPNPIHCHQDTRSAYDKQYVYRWWQILLQSWKVFEQFRSLFRGKSSPVQFFWGSFDLSYARYSGKIVSPPGYGGKIMAYAENEENFACGFWPGNANYPYAAFYSYFYPAPHGIENVTIKPQPASYNAKLGEFILNYDDVRETESPGELILEFLNSTYTQSAKLAGWDIESLRTHGPES